MELRPYQTEAVSAIWQDMCEGNNALTVLPTGCGKSIVIYEIIKKSIAIGPHIKAVVLFNRVPLLVEQTERAKSYLNTDVKNYCASINKKEIGQITFASVQSLVQSNEQFNLIIIDEVHCVDDKESVYKTFLDKQTNKKVVGFTATPFRNDGVIYGTDRLFKKISYKKDLLWAIKQGYLVRPVCKEPDFAFNPEGLKVTAGEYNQRDVDNLVDDASLVREQVTDALNRLANRKCVVWACANIKHAEKVKEVLESYGEEVETVHSEQDDYSSLEKFKKGKRHLTFVTVVAEGFDYAPIDAVVFMRPTLSPRLMVQICGRGLRLSEGKEDCLILDYASVFKHLGTLDNPIIQKKGKSKGDGKPPTRTCPECRGINHITFKECEHCGFVFPAPQMNERHTLTADKDAKLLSDEDLMMEVKEITFSNHVSKSGNTCKVIEYHSTFFYEPSIKEYFVETNKWAMDRYELRKIQAKNCSHIVYNYDGKYPRIKRVITKGGINVSIRDNNTNN